MSRTRCLAWVQLIACCIAGCLLGDTIPYQFGIAVALHALFPVVYNA